MQSRAFEAIGTGWEVRIDTTQNVESLFDAIQAHIETFDQQLSRFINTSEVHELKRKGAGTFDVSLKLGTLLRAGKVVEELTDGGFNLAIGEMLEKTGYNKEYAFQDAPETIESNIGAWSIKNSSVTLSAPTLFDIGSIGKGLLIDEVAGLITKAGFQNFLVDAGGDIFATQKSNGQGWKIALEWPGKPELALGMVELRNQGFAASDVYKRRWKNWNHLVSAKTGQPLKHLLGCMSLAPSAFVADQITSAICFFPKKKYEEVREKLGGEYVALLADQTAHISPGWPGTFF
jgi:thiamine biosynthesis lipoprotein